VTEAARPVLDHALYTLELVEVIADIDPKNKASINLALKLGFGRPARCTITGAPSFPKSPTRGVTVAATINPEAPFRPPRGFAR
jgi:Acetyltransferase (GNAT) domain